MHAYTCATASASASLNPSGIERAKAAGNAVTCDGLSPDTWAATSTSSWPVDSGTKFHSLFDPGLQGNPSLLQVLEKRNNLTWDDKLAKACVATLLNTSGSSPKVDPRFLGAFGSVQAVWSDAMSGNFVPNAGAQPWSKEKVIQWLATSWGVPWPDWS
ncbi:MAG: hypothetical protein HXY24_11055 [Rubrivivax sp.]|nr:hypothetical protein [Rubrivivax sp.]